MPPSLSKFLKQLSHIFGQLLPQTCYNSNYFELYIEIVDIAKLKQNPHSRLKQCKADKWSMIK